MIKYLGSKRTLLTTISNIVSKIDPKGSVIDLFSGTSRVGHALKSQGHRVISNDHNAYAATLSKCYVETDNDREREASLLVSEFNRMPGSAGYFTSTFCEKSNFFHAKER